MNIFERILLLVHLVMPATCDILWHMNDLNDETVPVESYKFITQFKRHDVRAGGLSTSIYENNNAMATTHILMKLEKQNMTKPSFKLAASESCGDVHAAECLVNG